MRSTLRTFGNNVLLSGFKRLLLLPLLLLAALPTAAHLMQAQRGTINIAGDGAFLVLSVPTSALVGVDDDGDGKLSAKEMRAHYADIESQIANNIKLSDASGVRPLQGLMLNLSPPDNAPNGPATQIVVLGRFSLGAAEVALRFEVKLIGKTPEENSYQITASRGDQSQLLVFNRERTVLPLFASAFSVFVDYVRLGSQHILLGFDHLLFLLVVLAAGWTWRQVLIGLTAFTLGHCVTLAISVWGGVNVAPAVVEPAIAATIVGMGLYDLRLGRPIADTPRTPWLRMSLVFGCALIHGLGLGATLLELGLDNAHRITSLAGFNLGIELGQIAVAAVAGAVLLVVRVALGANAVRLTTQSATVAGIVIGAIWFMQRVAESF